MNSITLEIPRDILDSAKLSTTELKQERAFHLYARGRLSIGKAKGLAGMPLWSFRQMLAARQIEAHFEPSDLDDEFTVWKKLPNRK